MKDYNSMLEDILETKDFSAEEKNLLLRMLYKIEERYDDYAKVKILVKEKEEFILSLLDIIKKECNNVEGNSESEVLKYLASLDTKGFKGEEYLVAILKEGECLNKEEIIRVFTGWSWLFEDEELQNTEYNLIYQTLQFILGCKVLENWKNSLHLDYVKEMRKTLTNIYGLDLGNRVYISLSNLIIKINSKYKTDDYQKALNEYLKNFFTCFNTQIGKVQTKKGIIKLIYLFRYYLILLNKFNVKDIEKHVENVGYTLIKKGIKEKALNIIHEDLKINYLITSKIFKTRYNRVRKY